MANIFADPYLQAFVSFLFGGYEQQTFNLAIYTVSMAVYALVLWNIYKIITKENIFVFEGMENTKVPTLTSALMYLVVFPIIVFGVFLAFALMLIFLAKGQTLQQILLISVTLISAIRIASYYHEEIAGDIAKLIPLTLLGVFLVDPTYYSTAVVVERLYALPLQLNLIMRYLLFTVLLEWTLRVLHRIRMWTYEREK
jgi:hypothetical protein